MTQAELELLTERQPFALAREIEQEGVGLRRGRIPTPRFELPPTATGHRKVCARHRPLAHGVEQPAGGLAEVRFTLGVEPAIHDREMVLSAALQVRGRGQAVGTGVGPGPDGDGRRHGDGAELGDAPQELAVLADLQGRVVAEARIQHRAGDQRAGGVEERDGAEDIGWPRQGSPGPLGWRGHRLGVVERAGRVACAGGARVRDLDAANDGGDGVQRGREGVGLGDGVSNELVIVVEQERPVGTDAIKAGVSGDGGAGVRLAAELDPWIGPGEDRRRLASIVDDQDPVDVRASQRARDGAREGPLRGLVGRDDDSDGHRSKGQSRWASGVGRKQGGALGGGLLEGVTGGRECRERARRVRRDAGLGRWCQNTGWVGGMEQGDLRAPAACVGYACHRMASRKITRHRASPITPPPANFRMEMTEDRQAAKAANRSSVPSRDLAIAIARLAADDKCTDVLVLDTRGLNPVSDYVIIASGTSDRQMRATCQHLEELGEELGHPPYRSSKDQRAVWLLVDFVDVIFHVFEPNTRAHYDLEMMWGDAPRVIWERPEGSRPPALATSGTMADRTAAAAQDRDADEMADVSPTPGVTSPSPAEDSGADRDGADAPSKRATPKKTTAKKAAKRTTKKAGAKPATSRGAGAAKGSDSGKATKKAAPQKAGAKKAAPKKSAGKATGKSGATKKPATHRGAAEKSASKGAAAKKSPSTKTAPKKPAAKQGGSKSARTSGGPAARKGASKATSKPAKKATKKKPAKR